MYNKFFETEEGYKEYLEAEKEVSKRLEQEDEYSFFTIFKFLFKSLFSKSHQES
jgi:hypothetical protein